MVDERKHERREAEGDDDRPRRSPGPGPAGAGTCGPQAGKPHGDSVCKSLDHARARRCLDPSASRRLERLPAGVYYSLPTNR